MLELSRVYTLFFCFVLPPARKPQFEQDCPLNLSVARKGMKFSRIFTFFLCHGVEMRLSVFSSTKNMFPLQIMGEIHAKHN